MQRRAPTHRRPLSTSDLGVSPDAPPRPAAVAGRNEPPSRLRVLLAEDHPLMRRVATAVLTRAGHHVIAVEDGRAAVAAAERSDVDVMLMDVHMPVMDGLTATRIIRDAERVRGGHVPIIALTADDVRDEQGRGMTAGLDGIVEKPFEVASLLAEIEAVVARAAQRPCACAAPAASCPFDVASVLDRIGGDEALLRELIDLFAEDVPVRLQSLEAAVRAGDCETVRRNAHALRGALLSLSAAPAAEAALVLERSNGEVPDAALLADLQVELERLRAALVAWSRSS